VLQHYPPRQLPTLPPANATTTEQVLIAVANLAALKTKRKNLLQRLLERRLKQLEIWGSENGKYYTYSIVECHAV
jgi:hypothetical protein